MTAHYSSHGLDALLRGETADPESYDVAPCSTCGDSPVRSVPSGCAHKSVSCGPLESEPCESCGVHHGLCFGCDKVLPIVAKTDDGDWYCLECGAMLASLVSRRPALAPGRRSA